MTSLIPLFPSSSAASSSLRTPSKCLFCYTPLIDTSSRYCGNACRHAYFRRLKRSRFTQVANQAFSLANRIDNPALRILMRTVIKDLSDLSP